MDIDIQYSPVNSMARVRLEPGEALEAEPGAMIGMSTNVSMQTGMRKSSKKGGGGFLKKIAGAAMAALSGESFFTNTFTSNGPGEVLLATALSGDMVVQEVPQCGITMQSGAYVANSPGIDVKGGMGSSQTYFGNEGLFVLNATASGPGQKLIFGAFGGIEEMQVDGSLVIDNGHLVAWESSLQMNLQKAATSWLGSFLAKEGKVFKIQGQGRVWIQTRQPIEFARALAAMLPPRAS